MLTSSREHSKQWELPVEKYYDRSNPAIFEEKQGGQGGQSRASKAESGRKWD